jgi:hypothetical protein
LEDDWQTAQMDLREETDQKALREGLAYSTTVPVRYNAEALKVVTYDCTSDRIGSLVKHLR